MRATEAGGRIPSRVDYAAIAVLFGVFGASVAWILSGAFPLSNIEAYYWDWSRHLDWGYMSKPPLIAYVNRVMTLLFGHVAWGLRLGSATAYVACLAVIYALVRRFSNDSMNALIALLATLAMTARWGWWYMAMTNVWQGLFWLLALYCYARALSGDRGMWLATGVALGMGMLSRYTTALLVLALALHLLVCARHALRRPGPWLALLTMLLMMSGVLYWNATHQWGSFSHTADLGRDAVAWTAWAAMSRVSVFLMWQLLLTLPLLAPLHVCALVWVWRHRGDHPLLPALCWCLAVPFLFYLAVSFQRDVLSSWPQYAFLSLGILIGLSADKTLHSRRRRALFGIAVGWGLVSGFILTPLDVASPDVASNIRNTMTVLLKDHPHAFLSGPSQYDVALISFYAPGQPQVYSVEPRRRMNQYDLWTDQQRLRGRDTLYIASGDATGTDRAIHFLLEQGLFDAAVPLGEIRVPDPWYRNEHPISFTLMTNYQPPPP